MANEETLATADFTADVGQQDEAIVVELSGELDLASAEDVRETFVRPDVLGARRLRVDLTRVTFIDSSCIGLIVSLCKRVRASGGAFSLVCGGGTTRHVFEVSGLVEYLNIEAAS